MEGKKTKRVRGRLVYSEEIVYSEGETDVTFLHDIYTSFTCIPHLFQICVVQYGIGKKRKENPSSAETHERQIELLFGRGQKIWAAPACYN